jgi:hypothetical protein
MPAFDQRTKNLIAELHAAWSHGATIATYAKLRDELLKEHVHAETRVATLSAVVQIACPQTANDFAGDQKWNDLFHVAQMIDQDTAQHDRPSPGKRKRTTPGETARIRNLALVSALWSPVVVDYYGWEEAARGHMKLLRACALKYPRFREDFCLRLNFVLIDRHCKAISSGRGRTLGEARLQPHIDLVIERLDSIAMDKALLNAWLASRDGAVPIDSKGTLLKDCRTEHFSMYLLEMDQFGMLKARITDESWDSSEPGSPCILRCCAYLK